MSGTRSRITDVECRVCEAPAGKPCHRQGSHVPIAGWHGGRVDDAARARGLGGWVDDPAHDDPADDEPEPDWLPPLPPTGGAA